MQISRRQYPPKFLMGTLYAIIASMGLYAGAHIGATFYNTVTYTDDITQRTRLVERRVEQYIRREITDPNIAFGIGGSLIFPWDLGQYDSDNNRLLYSPLIRWWGNDHTIARGVAYAYIHQRNPDLDNRHFSDLKKGLVEYIGINSLGIPEDAVVNKKEYQFVKSVLITLNRLHDVDTIILNPPESQEEFDNLELYARRLLAQK